MSYADYDYEPNHRIAKHSGLGIASVIIAVLSFLGIFLLLLAAGVMSEVAPEQIDDDNGPLTTGLGVLVLLALVLCVAGLALAIAGLFQPQRYKLFPILGLILNGLVILGTLLVVVIGLLVQKFG